MQTVSFRFFPLIKTLSPRKRFNSSIFLGHDIHGVGDVNGDGVDDLAISAFYESAIWLFFGGSGI